jgi:hypothetical protein
VQPVDGLGAADHAPEDERSTRRARWWKQLIAGVLVTVVSTLLISGGSTGWKWFWDHKGGPAPAGEIIDTMHSPAGWSPYKEEQGSSVILDSSAGSKQPFALDFSLVASGFVGITKRIPAGVLSGTRGIGFRYTGTGAPNTIEFKLLYPPEGGKEAIFGDIWPGASNTGGERRQIEIAYTDFTCWSDTGCRADQQLDPGHVYKVDFAVSNKPGDVVGRGSVSFENLVALPGT